MADRTRASIQIGAPAADVMAVIADLPAYPEWTGEVKQAEVLEQNPDSGRAARVRLSIDSGALRDQQLLDYTFDGDRAVHWTLVEGDMLRSLEGSYVLTPADGGPDKSTIWFAKDSRKYRKCRHGHRNAEKQGENGK